MKTLGVCKQCGEDVTFEYVSRVQSLARATFVIYTHSCGWVSQARFDSLEDFEAAKALAEKQAAKGYDPQVVGVQVAGFRIDLDTIETVEDLELHWFDDRRYRIG